MLGRIYIDVFGTGDWETRDVQAKAHLPSVTAICVPVFNRSPYRVTSKVWDSSVDRASDWNVRHNTDVGSSP